MHLSRILRNIYIYIYNKRGNSLSLSLFLSLSLSFSLSLSRARARDSILAAKTFPSREDPSLLSLALPFLLSPSEFDFSLFPSLSLSRQKFHREERQEEKPPLFSLLSVSLCLTTEIFPSRDSLLFTRVCAHRREEEEISSSSTSRSPCLSLSLATEISVARRALLLSCTHACACVRGRRRNISSSFTSLFSSSLLYFSLSRPLSAVFFPLSRQK